jgi:FdrA protein
MEAIKLFADDPETKVLVIISKPPAKSAAGKVYEAVKSTGKPAVLVFMGFKSDDPAFASTLEEGAAKAVALLNNANPTETKTAFPRGRIERRNFRPEQKYIHGFYTGGTLASEAKYILEENSVRNVSIIDLGDDKYTHGAVHPMIDPKTRNFMVAEAVDNRSTAIILCDVVIGYGSHANPAGELAKIVKGKETCVLTSVTGTDADPQNKSEQERILREAGIDVFPSNQCAAEAACKLINAGLQDGK